MEICVRCMSLYAGSFRTNQNKIQVFVFPSKIKSLILFPQVEILSKILFCLGKQKTYFLFLGKTKPDISHLRNQTKGLIFTSENKTTFSLAWDNKKYIYCCDMS